MKSELGTRPRLLEVAGDLIWRSSYGSVSVDDICRAARVNKGSFYFAFKSKADLAVDAMEQQWATYKIGFDHIFSAQLPALERIQGYCRAVVREQEEKFESGGKVLGCPFCSLGSELSGQERKIRQKAEQILGRTVRYLESAIKDLVAEGYVQTRNPAQLAREVHSYVMGVVMFAKIENNPANLPRIESGVMRLLKIKEPAGA